MKFTITFHTPFRVGTGRAGRGVDSTIDAELLLPASSLKGVMRAAARDLLRLDPARVTKVYGDSRCPSPWSWSDGTVTDANASDAVRPRARVALCGSTSTVIEGALAVAEEVLATGATFRIDRTGAIPREERRTHEAILLASARAVTAIGGDRRRGLGWVSVRPVAVDWPADDATQAAALVEALWPRHAKTGDQR